ncbi:sensor domain-containing diguanylate cyclase [Uliginosibacterium sp. H1]|uniref:sensor domain-containing diguanylate cyclase n=1 Tax=Uliginosibacterium sp. H1 TaxID=3114757 RepID=UPI002E18C099|nr:diguanylate cyclase [Uliginosibacterium sp. H1]
MQDGQRRLRAGLRTLVRAPFARLGAWLSALAGRDEAARVLAGVPHAAVMTDAGFRISAWNADFARRCGSLSGLLRHMPMVELLRGLSAQGLLDDKALPAAMAALKSAVGCDYSLTLGGVRMRVHQSRLEEGGLLWLLADETLLQQTRDSLAQTEQRCAALFEHAPAGLVLSSTQDGSIVRLNSRAQQQLGIAADGNPRDVHAQDFYANAEDRQDVESALRRIGEVHDRLVPLRSADGGELWANLSARKLTLGEHGFVLSILTDVTRMRSEARSSRIHLQKLEQLVEIAPTAIFLTRADDGRILFHNRRARLMMSGMEISLVGQRAPDFYVDQQERTRVLDEIVRSGFVENHDLRLHPPGSREPRWFQLSAVALDYEGSPAILTALHDIDERRSMEDALRAARADAEEASRKLREVNAELEQLALVDRLTQAFNRRHFEAVAAREMGRARRYNLPLALIIFDIDHFKHINDDYGHAAGDIVLKEFVQLLGERLRDSDVLARWGGEEFVVLAPSTSLDEAHKLAENLRDRVARHAFIEVGTVSASAGVTELNFRDTLDSMLRRADRALYRAKALGRNQVNSLEADAVP